MDVQPVSHAELHRSSLELEMDVDHPHSLDVDYVDS